MLSNTINHLMNNNNNVTLLTTTELKDNVFERNLIKKSCTIFVKKNNDEIINLIDDLSKINDYILLRNTQLLNQIKNKSWLKKTTLYCVGNDFEDIKNLDNQYNSIITQSEVLKQKYVEKGVNKDNILIKEPIAYKYDFDLPEKNEDEIRLIYCGTLRDEENILEIIDEFKKIHKERPEVLLKIVYGKINANSNEDFNDKVNAYIKNGVKGITFKHNLSHKDACYEIARSDIGICCRKNGWGDNGEISTKVKEYQMYGLEITNDINFISEKFKINKKVNIKFGKKYTQFLSKIKNNNIKYDFTYETVESNKLNKKIIFKNVFYKIIYKDNCTVYLFNEKDTKNNIFRNCLHGKNLYFTVNTNALYYLKIKTQKNQMINIENYISINYICGDNVFMLNLNSQKDKFQVKEMILNKMGIKVTRFEAINGYNNKYDKLWDKISKSPFTDLEKRLGRKAIISRGGMGYLLSMEKIFSSIKSNYVCIFDDDILISKDLSIEKLTEILVNFSDFNILKFGSSQWNFDNIKILKNFYYPNDLSNGSFACIYRSTTYKDILQKIRNFNEPFDFSPLRQFNNNKSYVIYPNIIIANLSDISTITSKTREKDYKRFKWDIDDYIKLPYIENKKVLKNSNITKKPHFLFGITTFKRTDYLVELINSLIPTLKKEHFFTIIVSKGLDLIEKEDYELEQFLINSFKKFNNINLIINYSYLHYIYNTSNAILKLSENINYDFGFILNDDILLYDNWYMSYYNISKKNNIIHLCWLRDTNTTLINKNDNLKHNGCVLNANGALLTFTKDLVNNVGFFNEIDFKVRGQSHIEWSLRCCNKGYNNKNNFYDIINSNELIKLNTNNYTSAISNTKYFDKVIHFVDKYELKRRNKLLNKLFNMRSYYNGP